MKKILLITIFLPIYAAYAALPRIIVAADGSGDFKTITEAIASLPMYNYERRVIYIRNGIYNEKVRIEQDNITLSGESREKTIIRYNQPRPDWIAKKDSIGPAVINIFGDDLVIENLTVENTQPAHNVHAFVLYAKGTRIVLQNCSFISQGGDTVSLWDYKTGMYYHANCYFEGGVDFVCPRGWCYIKDSRFYEVTNTEALWHAGGFDRNQKFVIHNSTFDGVKDFNLGRHHYEAQFYLLDCRFSENMSDKPIFRVVSRDSAANRPFNWGERYYFYNCHREGGDFPWFADNLNSVHLQPRDLTPKWTFDGKWDPESPNGPGILSVQMKGNRVYLIFDEIITIQGNPKLQSASGKIMNYLSGAGSDTMCFSSAIPLIKSDLKGLTITNEAKILGTRASTADRNANLTIGEGEYK